MEDLYYAFTCVMSLFAGIYFYNDMKYSNWFRCMPKSMKIAFAGLIFALNMSSLMIFLCRTYKIWH